MMGWMMGLKRKTPQKGRICLMTGGVDVRINTNVNLYLLQIPIQKPIILFDLKKSDRLSIVMISDIYMLF